MPKKMSWTTKSCWVASFDILGFKNMANTTENGFKAFDLVLHDGSPNVGGAWAQEATSQNALVIDSVKLATEFLAPKGTFLTKVSFYFTVFPLLFH